MAQRRWFAQYAVVRVAALERIPVGVSYEHAAAVPTSALIALDNIGGVEVIRGRRLDGRRVLVNGAAGGTGVFIVQFAQAAAADVVGVECGDKLDLLRALGCDEVVDYLREDFTSALMTDDLVIDSPGNRSLDEIHTIVTPGGRYVFIGHDGYGTSTRKHVGSAGRFLRMPFQSRRRPEFWQSFVKAEDNRLAIIAELMTAGLVVASADAAFPLADAADALR